jgi:hypothetical protein
MKRLIIFIAILYVIFGITFYMQDLQYSRRVIHIENEPQKIALVNESPTAFTMMFLWPLLLLGKVIG